MEKGEHNRGFADDFFVKKCDVGKCKNYDGTITCGKKITVNCLCEETCNRKLYICSECNDKWWIYCPECMDFSSYHFALNYILKEVGPNGIRENPLLLRLFLVYPEAKTTVMKDPAIIRSFLGKDRVHSVLVDVVKYAISLGYEIDPDILYIEAGKGGDTSMLDWLVAAGYKYPERLMDYIVTSEIGWSGLQWAIAHGVPWDEKTLNVGIPSYVEYLKDAAKDPKE